MIIWGSRGLNSTLESGTFHCPRCATEKPFRIVAVKRWFTLYFIPVFPMEEAGRFLECQSCAATYDEAVRHYDPAIEERAFRASFENAMLNSMLAMACADGTVDNVELEAIANIMTHLTGTGYEVEEVVDALNRAGPLDLDNIIERLPGSLSEEGVALVMKSLYMIASVDGVIDDGELDLIYRVGKNFGFRRKDIDRFLGTAAE